MSAISLSKVAVMVLVWDSRTLSAGPPLGNHLHSAALSEVKLICSHAGDPRRYKRRWTIKRTFAWLGNPRRLVVRHDRSLNIYQAFFHTACFMIVLRRVLK